jgi:amino acid transporter
MSDLVGKIVHYRRYQMNWLVTFISTDFVAPSLIFFSGLYLFYIARSRRSESFPRLGWVVLNIISPLMMIVALVLIVQTFMHRH